MNHQLQKFPTLREADVRNKRVLVRVDFDVPLEDGKIVDDTRILTNLPTLKHLLQHGNRIILIAKLGRPKGRDPKLSLKALVEAMPCYLPGYTFRLIDDFLEEKLDTFVMQPPREVIVLENIRFYSDDVADSPDFLKALATLGEVYVNDAFAMAHRKESSVTGLPTLLPSYAGLSLEKEVRAIERVMDNPKKPLVAIVGGAKIETKVEPIKRLIEICDHILIGGGIANTFLKAHGYEIGASLCDDTELTHAQELIDYASDKPVTLMLPIDARVGNIKDPHAAGHIVSLPTIPENGHILDIGPATAEIYEEVIAQAHTIVWNGPMGVFEHEAFKHGTDSVYRAIVHNADAFSLVGGGDTLAALAQKHQKEAISHITTGGGAMLHFIEFGDLPALEALRKSLA
jgi:phosphoglycerate kinase